MGHRLHPWNKEEEEGLLNLNFEITTPGGHQPCLAIKANQTPYIPPIGTLALQGSPPESTQTDKEWTVCLSNFSNTTALLLLLSFPLLSTP